MSQQKPRTLTLRDVGHSPKAGDYKLTKIYIPSAFESDEGPFYRVVSPIPEGYEVCALADATKVLIGETWLERAEGAFAMGELTLWPFRFEGLGVLAIRPIPEPEPMRGENVALRASGSSAGCVILPKELIGKVIRWEVVKDGGE